jgi:tetratricopeptide (TPR) repeat protein
MITLPNGQTVSADVFNAFALSQASSPNSWFWGVYPGLYPHYASAYYGLHGGYYAPYWYAPFFGFGYGYGGYGGYGGLSFGYSSGHWAIGASIGFPAFGYQSAPYYYPAPAYYSTYAAPAVVVPSAPAVVVPSPSVVIPPAVETLPPPTVQAEKPAIEPTRPAAETNYAQSGMEHFQAGRYPEAVRALRHAVVDDPRNGGLLALTGQALFASGSLNEAAGALQQSLAAMPETQWVDASSRVAKLAPAEATEALRKAIDKDPNSPGLRFLAAYQSFGQADYKQAQTHLDALLKVAPDDTLSKKFQAQAKKLAEGKE